MTDAEHVCTYYCQEGLHAYLCLSSQHDDAAEVTRSAQVWLAYLGWPHAVVRVAPARESDAQQVLQDCMLAVGDDVHATEEVQVDVAGLDLSRYAVWVIWIQEA
jgi:hypothetical protein